MPSKISLTIGIIIVILTAFLMTNAEFLFPGQGQAIQLVMIIYAILFVIPLAFTAQTTAMTKTKLDDILTLQPISALMFIAGVGLTYLIVVPAIPASVVAGFDILRITAIVPYALVFVGIYVFVKAYIEEIFFRGFLEEKIGRYGSIVLFGLFHLAILSIGQPALPTLLVSVAFLMVLGLIWSFMKDVPQLGFMFAVGSHTMWNLHAVGLL